jgi:hypothetical protein
MSKTNDIKELSVLSMMAAAFQSVILISLFIFEIIFPNFFSGTTLGFFLGSVVMFINLQILAKGWAPLLLFSKGAGLAFASLLFSLLFLGITAFALFKKFPSSSFGFAFAFACLPIGCCFYAFRLSRCERDGPKI